MLAQSIHPTGQARANFARVKSSSSKPVLNHAVDQLKTNRQRQNAKATMHSNACVLKHSMFNKDFNYMVAHGSMLVKVQGQKNIPTMEKATVMCSLTVEYKG